MKPKPQPPAELQDGYDIGTSSVPPALGTLFWIGLIILFILNMAK